MSNPRTETIRARIEQARQERRARVRACAGKIRAADPVGADLVPEGFYPPPSPLTE